MPQMIKVSLDTILYSCSATAQLPSCPAAIQSCTISSTEGRECFVSQGNMREDHGYLNRSSAYAFAQHIWLEQC